MKTKEEIISKFREMYASSDYAVVIEYKGMNATDTASFRGDLRTKCNARFFVIKNTLNKISAKDSEYNDNLKLKGQCGVIFCNDLTNVSKVVNDFCFKNQKAKFVACLNRKDICSEEQIKELALLPSIEVLRTKLLYVLNSVGSSLVRAMAEKIKKSDEEKAS